MEEREGEREGEIDGGREGGREGGTEGGRERGREGGREGRIYFTPDVWEIRCSAAYRNVGRGANIIFSKCWR